MATRPSVKYQTRTITIDSGTYFFDKPADFPSSFSVDLQDQINLTGPTEVCLSSIYITAYKLNEIDALHWAPHSRDDVVNVFNIEIPQFCSRNVGGRQDSNSHAHKRFSLINEKDRAPAHPGILETDYKPFVIGHLGQTAIYISTLPPVSFSRIDVKITDQNGKSIFKENMTAAPVANPPISARRIYMQFLLKTSKEIYADT